MSNETKPIISDAAAIRITAHIKQQREQAAKGALPGGGGLSKGGKMRVPSLEELPIGAGERR